MTVARKPKTAAIDAALAKRGQRASALFDATVENIPDLVQGAGRGALDVLGRAYGVGKKYVQSRTPQQVAGDVAKGLGAVGDATARYATDRAQNPLKLLGDAYGVGKDFLTAVPQAVGDVAQMSERAQALKATDPAAARRMQAAIAMAAMGVMPGVRTGKKVAKAVDEAEKLAAKYGLPETPKLLTHTPRGAEDWTKDAAEFAAAHDVGAHPGILLHGSPNPKITEFDPYGHSKYGLMGAGTYLTDNAPVAIGYSGKGLKRAGPEGERTLYAVYAKVKNPINMDAPADIEKWAKAAGDYADFTPGMTNEQAYREVEDALAGEGIPAWEGSETMQGILQGMGHDGVTHVGGGRIAAESPSHKVLIAHDPEQTNIVGRMKVGEQKYVVPEAREPKQQTDDRWTPYRLGGLAEKYGYQTGGFAIPGNIDLHNRPVVHNADDSISTVRSITVGFGDKTYVLPTVIGDKVVSNKEAIDHFKKTGEHLGAFDTLADAEGYSQRLHEDQAKEYEGRALGGLIRKYGVEGYAKGGTKKPTDIELAVQKLTHMKPGIERPQGLLPLPFPQKDGKDPWTMPQFAYDLAKAFVTPGVAAQGGKYDTGDVVNMAMNVTGSGLGASHIAGPTVSAGEYVLGMGVKPKTPVKEVEKLAAKYAAPAGFKDIRTPRRDYVQQVVDASFDRGRIVGNQTAPLKTLTGGVTTGVDEQRRVNDLVREIGSDDGYFERLIVDQDGNVVEGQHRLEALRKLGVENVPIVRIRDVLAGFPVQDVKQAINTSAGTHPDNVNQILEMLADAYAEEKGSVAKLRSNWTVPRGFETQWNAALSSLEKASAPAQNLGAKYGLPEFTTDLTPAQIEANRAAHMAGAKSPPVLYHGTTQWEGDAYNPNRATVNRTGNNIAGFYADERPKRAESYALDWRTNDTEFGEGANVMPVHVAIKNPFIPGKTPVSQSMLDAYATELRASNRHLGSSGEDWVANKVRDAAQANHFSIGALNGDGMAYQRVVRAGGYDGLKDGTAWVAFEPTQVKSTMNRGTFDPTDPHLNKAHGGPVSAAVLRYRYGA